VASPSEPERAPRPRIRDGLWIVEKTALGLLEIPATRGCHPEARHDAVAYTQTSAGPKDLAWAARESGAAATKTSRPRPPLRPGRGVERAYHLVRERIPPLARDRVPAPDIEAAATLVRDGVFAEIWKS
jgi:hypothetical protein